MYPVFYIGFLCKGCVWEREWRLKAMWRVKKLLRVAREKSSREVKHAHSTWLECEKSWQMVTAGFHECLVGTAFPWDTHEIFCFANLSYLIHWVSTHTIYTHITHILRWMLFREKTLATFLKSERLLYPQFCT